MTRRLALLPAALAAGALVLTGCSSPGGDSEDGRVEVLASFYPLQFVAERVGGDLVDVQNLTPPAAEPHDLELAPSQVRAIGQADLVVYLSGFQPAVDEAIDQQAPTHLVDAAEVARLEERPNGGEPAGDATPTDEDDEHTADDGHDHGSLDPHFWLDPTRLGPVADTVADRLAAIDPDNADAYRANASALADDLAALDTEMSTALAPCAGATLVTSHEAFGYLAERYDLDQVGITGIDPEAEPSPARLREIGRVVEDDDVSTLYFETLVSPKIVTTLANDLGVDSATLDPLESLAEDATDYLGVMRTNLDALTTGLTCS